MLKCKEFFKDMKGDAVVEATILFPIMIMIFTGLALLSSYLPARASLQRATQYAATALATERSDTWLYYDENNMTYAWKESKAALDNVYKTVLQSVTGRNDSAKAETMVRKGEKSLGGVSYGELEVTYGVVNYIVYKEIVVTATRTIPTMVNLSFVGFPKEIEITSTATAVVQNGDEFVRNLDIAADFTKYLDEKYELSEKVNKSNIFKSVKDISTTFSDQLGWGGKK